MAESYGNDLVETQAAMSLTLGFEPILDVYPIALAWFGPVTVHATGAIPGAVGTVLIGSGEAEISLAPAIDATLLVGSVAATVGPRVVDQSGRFNAFVFDFNDPALVDIQFSMQAIALAEVDDLTSRYGLSNGVTVSIEGMLGGGGDPSPIN